MEGPNEGCVHHWLLGSPDDEDVVHGQCKLCGARRCYEAVLEGVGRFGVHAERNGIGHVKLAMRDGLRDVIAATAIA